MLSSNGEGAGSSCARIETLEQRRLLSVVPSFVPVPISAAAKAADPSLANYSALDLRVTISRNDRWASTDLKIVLSAGHFYEPAVLNSNTPNPALWPFLPNLEFDTWVTATDSSSPLIFGKYLPGGAAGTGVFSASELNVSWGGGLAPIAPGTYTIARLTMTFDAAGEMQGRIGSTGNPLSSEHFALTLPLEAPTRTISGFYYQDYNRNGQHDSIEVATGGLIYLDANNDGIRQSTERSEAPNPAGQYSFPFMDPGTYVVRADRKYLSDPVTFTQPAGFSPSYTATITAGQNASGLDFGITTSSPTTITGTVFVDSNGNGFKESTDGGLAGVTVFVDANDNSLLEAGEQSAVSGTDGFYSFTTPLYGSYPIREITPSGYRQSSDLRGTQRSLGSFAVSLNFGNMPRVASSATLAAAPPALIGVDGSSITRDLLSASGDVLSLESATPI